MDRRKYLEKYPHMAIRPYPRNYKTAYVFRGESGRLLYVGQSADVGATLNLHATLDIWFEGVKTIELHRCTSGASAAKVLTEVVKAEGLPCMTSKIDGLG